MTFLWLKALHIVSVIAWMAGVLYFWRLLVYHAMETEPVVIERFLVMEGRLRKAIMTPAMIATWLFGLGMLYVQPGLLSNGWMHAKLGLVLLLSAHHGLAVRTAKKLEVDRTAYDHKWLRVMNEVPTVLMIGIVFLVVLRPF